MGDEAHDYGLNKRQAMYFFVARHFGLSYQRLIKPSCYIDESGVALEKEDKMHVFNSKHPMPKYAYKGNDALTKAFEKMKMGNI